MTTLWYTPNRHRLAKKPTPDRALPLRHRIFAILFLTFISNSASAESALVAPHEFALVETTTLATYREAVRVYTQLIEIPSGLNTASPLLLPGTQPLFLPVFAHENRNIAVTTGDSSRYGAVRQQTYVSVIDGPTNQLAESGWTMAEPGWSHRAACFVRGADETNALLVTLATPLTDESVGPGRIEVRTLSPDVPAALASAPASWLLPGAPIAAVEMPESSRVAVLCRDDRLGTILHVRDVDRGEVVVERETVFDDAPGLAPSALARTEIQNHLIVLATGPGFGQGAAHDATWIRIVDPKSWRSIGAPLELPGVPGDDSRPIHTAKDGSFWVATREPHSGFAFLTHLSADATALAKLAEYSFSGTASALHVALATSGPALAIGIGERVEIWQDGKPGGTPVGFDSPVRALEWSMDRLLVGAANAMYQIVPANDRVTTEPVTSFQTGVVTGITPLIVSPDGVSASETNREAPRLHPPRLVRFRGESAGREIRAIQIMPARDEPVAWRLEWDRDRMPWLNAYPPAGTVAGWFLVGVDDQLYDRGATHTGWVELHVESRERRIPYAGSPYRIAVRIAPSRPPVRRILWALGDAEAGASLRDEDDRYHMKTLADLLASPPLHFSHHLPSSPITGSPAQYTIVVLDSGAIASGIVTRQAMLDYVSNGGALLYLAQRSGDQNPDGTARWFTPIGLTIDPAATVSEEFRRVVATPLLRDRTEWTMSQAAELSVDGTWQVLMASPDGLHAGLAVRNLGAGCIAVLASRDPLTSGRLHQLSERRFATALFEWLGNAGRDLQDLDDDGLPDEREDTDSDGAVGSGETDRMNPDTDGDGVADGIEDRNRNGMLDEGETDPLNPDTDGDGIYDGADLTPLAAAPS